MAHDQCHSTVKGEKRRAGKSELAAAPRELQRVSGQPAWRSLNELVDEASFREHLEREFPSGMAELVTRERVDLSETGSGAGDSRRDFLKLMGASVALAGAATIPGCRRPDHKIYPYSRTVPEDAIPGKPLYYTTSMVRFDGGAEGLLVETHEGRPTKIEGNPLHPSNRGKCSSWAMASIMELYDPDRLKEPVYRNPTRGRVAASWDDFRVWGAEHFAAYDATQGQGLAIIADKADSPTRSRVKGLFLRRWPKARWVAYSPAESLAEFEGTKAAFGAPMRTVFNFTREGTAVIVSLDRDCLNREAGDLAHARGFASTRTLRGTKDAMSRVYAVESGVSTLGASADHRLRMSPSGVHAFAIELARFVLPKLGDPTMGSVVAAAEQWGSAPLSETERFWMEECAKDLLDAANRGKSAILAGPTQPPAVHALVAALNQALGNVGKSVAYLAVDEDRAANSAKGLADLCAAITAGEVKTLVCVNVNPAYDAPGDLGFAEAFAKVPATITLSVSATETTRASTWALNSAHYLESWGDTRALDGTIAPTQPMIAPLYDPLGVKAVLSDIEFIALLAGADMYAHVDGFALVRETWRTNLEAWGVAGATDFESRWRRALHDGVLAGTGAQPTAPAADAAAVAGVLEPLKSQLQAASAERLDVVFAVGNVADGRYANIPWLQELPEVGTRIVWDNVMCVSPRTAMDLGLTPEGFRDTDSNGRNAMYTSPKYPTARLAELTLGGRKVTGPVWILPGMPDHTILLTFGYGRGQSGLVCDGVGFNVYGVRESARAGSGLAASGATLKGVPGERMIVSTQNHWTLDSKTSVIRAVDLPAWRKHGDKTQEVVDSFYATAPGEKHPEPLNFAERLGELGHTPPNLSLYVNPLNRSRGDADEKAIVPGDPNGPAFQKNKPPAFTSRPQWAMTIDQAACTGCGACIIACQSENNIPVVGKKEVAKGREMHWIRVDRYFTGEDFHNPTGVHHQPVACVHCENAPCEVVCPVNATVHGPEGLNYMTYNRCIGTRYCANNCPYKVRRYNWFDYGVTKFNGGYYGKDLVESIAPDRGGITGSGEHNQINPNLIPPRLREKLDEISRMQKNPDVTVRSRGVMEKCTYCVQRINAARIECKLADIRDGKGNPVIPEGFFEVACQQACPSDAIVFGDELDENSRVHASRRNARSYGLLGYLNTRPRTSHLVRVMNPNPVILARLEPERFQRMEEPFHHEGAGHESHGPEGETGGAHSSLFERRERTEDGGYALALRVLGGGRA